MTSTSASTSQADLTNESCSKDTDGIDNPAFSNKRYKISKYGLVNLMLM